MTPNGIALKRWASTVGVSAQTVRNWSKTIVDGEPVVRTHSIFGYLYILEEDDRRFWERVKSGAFKNLPDEELPSHNGSGSPDRGRLRACANA